MDIQYQIKQNAMEYRSMASDLEWPSEDRDLADIARQKGNDCFKEKKYKKAASYYSQAQILDPKNPVHLINRAMARLKLENYPSVIEDCNLAIKLDPVNVKAHYRRAIAFENMQQLPEAQKDLETCLRLNPKMDQSDLKRLQSKITPKRILEVKTKVKKKKVEKDIQPLIKEACFIASNQKIKKPLFSHEFDQLLNQNVNEQELMELITIKDIPILFKTINATQLSFFLRNVTSNHEEWAKELQKCQRFRSAYLLLNSNKWEKYFY